MRDRVDGLMLESGIEGDDRDNVDGEDVSSKSGSGLEGLKEGKER